MSDQPSSLDNKSLNRKEFVLQAAKSAGGLALLGLQPSFYLDKLTPVKKQFTAQEIINIILKQGKLAPLNDTVDTVKCGRADQVVTGIVTTMFPTIPVIEQAAEIKANFIIAHEPSFYNHRDDAEWVKNNTVLKQKLLLLDKYKIVIWRFHDYCHAIKPDIISYGLAKKASWLPYYKSGENILTIPPVSLQQLVQNLKASLNIGHVRVIGNLSQQCSRIALLPGAWGGQRQVSVVEAEKPDVLIVGEVSEWETAEYIRDTQLLGGKTSLIILGHAVSEEPGMEWLVDWLKPILNEVKITHIASQDPFIWL